MMLAGKTWFISGGRALPVVGDIRDGPPSRT